MNDLPNILLGNKLLPLTHNIGFGENRHSCLVIREFPKVSPLYAVVKLNAEAYLELNLKSRMELFATIVDGF